MNVILNIFSSDHFSGLFVDLLGASKGLRPVFYFLLHTLLLLLDSLVYVRFHHRVAALDRVLILFFGLSLQPPVLGHHHHGYHQGYCSYNRRKSQPDRRHAWADKSRFAFRSGRYELIPWGTLTAVEGSLAGDTVLRTDDWTWSCYFFAISWRLVDAFFAIRVENHSFDAFRADGAIFVTFQTVGCVATLFSCTYSVFRKILVADALQTICSVGAVNTSQHAGSGLSDPWFVESGKRIAPFGYSVESSMVESGAAGKASSAVWAGVAIVEARLTSVVGCICI